jgi:putative tryptophan/tyrosine transport system substrate-binding protein
VAVIFDSEVPSQPPYLQAIEAAAPSTGVQVTFVDVHNSTDIENRIKAFAQEPSGSMVVVPNPLTIVDRDHIIALAARHGLPAVYPYRFFASGGGLMSYGIDLADQYRRAASYVDAILKGAKPGELPVQLSTKFELVVNLKVANSLGLTIPEPFLQQADKVIE